MGCNASPYRAIEPGIVVNINNARRASVETRLDERVVLGEVRGVEGARFGPTRQELPADGETEGVEAVVVHVVRHLTLSIAAWWRRCYPTRFAQAEK